MQQNVRLLLVTNFPSEEIPDDQYSFPNVDHILKKMTIGMSGISAKLSKASASSAGCEVNLEIQKD